MFCSVTSWLFILGQLKFGTLILKIDKSKSKQENECSNFIPIFLIRTFKCNKVNSKWFLGVELKLSYIVMNNFRMARTKKLVIKKGSSNTNPNKKYKVKKSSKGNWADDSWTSSHRCIDTYHSIKIKLPIGNFEISVRNLHIFTPKSSSNVEQKQFNLHK